DSIAGGRRWLRLLEVHPGPPAGRFEHGQWPAGATPEKNPWSAITVAHVETFPNVLGLGYLKQQTALAELPLVQKAVVCR
ncbi:hypothetical protein ACQX3R_11865, partial [Corynebacterium diphtheriae]